MTWLLLKNTSNSWREGVYSQRIIGIFIEYYWKKWWSWDKNYIKIDIPYESWDNGEHWPMQWLLYLEPLPLSMPNFAHTLLGWQITTPSPAFSNWSPLAPPLDRSLQNTFFNAAPTDFALKSHKSLHRISKVMPSTWTISYIPSW